MILAEITTGINGLINEKVCQHLKELGKQAKEFKFKMANRGTLGSSAFKQGITDIYMESFQNLANDVFEKIGSYLAEIGFEPEPGCETELAAIIKEPLQSITSTYYTGLDAQLGGCSSTPGISRRNDVLYVAVLQNIDGKVKRLVQKLRAARQREKTSSSRALGGTRVMAKKARTRLSKTLEKRVFQEAGSKCAFCPETYIVSLQIHHIDGNPSNNAFENLILVCALCHTKITGGVISEEAVRLKKRQPANLA